MTPEQAREQQRLALEERHRIELEQRMKDQAPARDFTSKAATTTVTVEIESGETRTYDCVSAPHLLNGFLYLETVELVTELPRGNVRDVRRRVTLLVSRLFGWTEEPIVAEAEAVAEEAVAVPADKE